jgi:lactate dehydrogenase-like 2-hydroxyacid dehydrogenase
MALLTLTEEYNNRVENYIYDVAEHMERLKTYATQCSHITELGIGNVGSTFAFLAGLPANVVSYDASPMEIKEIDRVELADLALANNVTFTFVEEDPLDVTIANTDLLFIHDATEASRLAQELSLHGNKASKFIIVPLLSVDNEAFLTAINNFVGANPSWTITENLQQWCGLVVLSK